MAARREAKRTKAAVAVVQMNPKLGDLEANLGFYEAKLEESRGAGADLTVFPELSLTGYFLKDMVTDVAVRLDSAEVHHLRGLSRRSGAIVAGLVLEDPDYRLFNAALFIDRGEILHVHRKVYLPTYGLFDEQRYLASGDSIRAFESRFGRAAILICEDAWHVSSFYIAGMDGALMVLVPSASPIWGIREGSETPENARYWERLNRFYAESLGIFLLQANRVGFEDGVGFWGGSEILGPEGARLAKAKYYEEEIVFAELDFADVRRRRQMAPMLRDEDIDLTINELLRIRGRAAVETGLRAVKRPVRGKAKGRLRGRPTKRAER